MNIQRKDANEIDDELREPAASTGTLDVPGVVSIPLDEIKITYVRSAGAAVPALERALPRYLPREHAWDGEWDLVLSILSVRHGRIIPKPDDGGK